MLNQNQKAADYWKANLRLITVSLIVWWVLSYGMGILFRPFLTGIIVGGTDLGFWFAQQGSIIGFIVLIFFYAWRMNRLDKTFGLEEE
jgi:putative solute:sodium symporter small subunit